MSDLISRKALIEEMMEDGVWYHGKKVYDLITNAQAITPQQPQDAAMHAYPLAQGNDLESPSESYEAIARPKELV